MLKKLRPAVTELTVILRPSYFCCDDYLIFVCFRNLSSHYFIEISQSLNITERHSHGNFGSSIEVNGIGDDIR